jgi:hypothetical protein
VLLGLAVGVTLAAEPERGRTFEFTVRRAELISTVRTIGVMPITVSAEVPDAEGVATRYESDIVARLTSGGFSVVPPSAMREIRERARATLGGPYDPMTGDVIKERVAAFNEFSANEYRSKYKVDATLDPMIALRTIDFGYGYIQWDGIDDSVTGRSPWVDFVKPTEGIAGQMPVLSFGVRLVDASGKVSYVGVGGLQVIGYWKNVAGAWGYKERMMMVEPKFIMTDPARDARALALALDPLIKGKISPLPKVARLPPPPPEPGGAGTPSREDLLARFPRLVLASLGLDGIKQRDQVRLRYRELLTQKLTQLGFEVISGDDYDRLWEAERTAAGGYFDPFTGRLDVAKLKASRQRVLRSMPEGLAATAIVLPIVLDRQAEFSSGTAEWDGLNEPLTNRGWLTRALTLDKTVQYSGALSAISLEVQIIDPAGERVFQGLGGIQLTGHFNPAGAERVAESELFSDPARDTRAIDIALAPLAAPVPTAHH